MSSVLSRVGAAAAVLVLVFNAFFFLWRHENGPGLVLYGRSALNSSVELNALNDSVVCPTGFAGFNCTLCAAGFGPSFPRCAVLCTSVADCSGRGKASGYKGSCVCQCNSSFCGLYCESCCSDNCCAPPACARVLQPVNYGRRFPAMRANLVVNGAVQRDAASRPFHWVNSFVAMDSVVPRNATRFIANKNFSSTYEVGGGLLLEAGFAGYAGWHHVDTMAVQLNDRLIVDISSEVLSFHRENYSEFSKFPRIYDATRDQWQRLKAHNFSDVTTWRINSTRVFCAWSQVSRHAGHLVRAIFTMMGIFLRAYGNVTTGEIAIAVVDPANLDFGYSPVYSAELVYWIFKYVNVKVVFLPRFTPVFADTMIFTRSEEEMNDFALSFVRDVLWPNVQTEYASYPTYDRVALIKPAKTGGSRVGSGRGFVISDRFLVMLKASGYFLITLDMPSAERMWYMNHAKRCIITAGSQKDVLLWLRAGNFSSVNGLFLVHSGYLWEFRPFTWTSCDRYNITNWQVFGYPPFSTIHLHNDSLDSLTLADLDDNHLWRGQRDCRAGAGG